MSAYTDSIAEHEVHATLKELEETIEAAIEVAAETPDSIELVLELIRLPRRRSDGSRPQIPFC